jgi:hypothetical protein
VLWHRAQRCNPGLAHPSLAHVGLESYTIVSADCTTVQGKRWWWRRGRGRWEGCERKSQSTSEVLGRELIDVMNEGVDTGGCMVAPCRAERHCSAEVRVHAIGESAHALSRMGETRRASVHGAGCPQRVEWPNAPCPSSQTGLSGGFGSDGKLAALVLVTWALRRCGRCMCMCSGM